MIIVYTFQTQEPHIYDLVDQIIVIAQASDIVVKLSFTMFNCSP